MSTKIVIVGAGYAGILTAKALAKKTKKINDIEITIIDKNPYHTMLTELHEVAAQRVEEDSIKISLKKVFAGRKVKIILDKVNEIDYNKKAIKCKNQVVDYDYLIMASGSKPTFFGVEGAKENAFTLWSVEDAVKIREHINNMFRLAASEPNNDKKRQLLSFYVVGAGLTGVEMVGELAELIPVLCKQFEIPMSLVQIRNVDVLERVCPALPEKLSDKIVNRLKKMHVEIMLKTNITSVSKNSITYTVNGTDITEKTNTVIWTAGVEGSDIVNNSSSELTLAGRGRIQTDEYLCSLDNKNVYVVGDNIFYIPKGEASPVPQMVENCEASSHTVADNILCDITGTGEKHSYKPTFHGVMVCIGGRYGVANVGSPSKMFALPSFLAMFTKHFINIVYFAQVLGWNKIFSYLRHEFFTVRNCRSFVGGHFSNRSPSFFLVPLRIFLGFIWVYEGVVKITQGWLANPNLTNYFTSANRIYNQILYPDLFPIDATTSASVAETATNATTSVGTALININILNLVKIILVHTSDYAFKIQVGLVDIMMQNFVLPFDNIQMFFQVVIVISEILIGLALIGGLFTTAASAYSLILQGMFLTSTGLYMSTWWMIFAGVAMLFGAGRSFSLDYYVMPFLKEQWNKIGFVKKWYLYND